MFDPTAFDNMKVVTEGAAYDLDLSGDLRIIDRKDIVDLATMSRKYELKFSLKQGTDLEAHLILEANGEQIMDELQGKIGFGRAGALITLIFSWKNGKWSKHDEEKVKQLWGEERTYERRDIISSQAGTVSELIIEFNRLITEEMVDDLVEMVNHINHSLHELQIK